MQVPASGKSTHDDEAADAAEHVPERSALRPAGLLPPPPIARSGEHLVLGSLAPQASRADDDTGEIELPEVALASVPPARSLAPPLAVVLRYEILGLAAVGGMAEIFYATERTQTEAVRPVALKVVRRVEGPEDLQAMFTAEGRLAMRLTHPAVCHVYDFGRIGDELFIAMEWVDGVTWGALGRALATSDLEFDPVIVAGIASQVAGALHYAHHARDERGRVSGVIHRDVSPQNVMISFDGTVKLLDFGVAKASRPRGAAREEGDTDKHTLKGKFGYFSPEQVRGETLDGRSDVFALGVCLWETLTRRRLFKRATELGSLEALLLSETPSIRAFRPELPDSLDAIVQRATQKEPSRRYGSARDMEEALLSFIADRREVVSSARIADLVRHTMQDRYEAGPTLDRGEAVVARVQALRSLVAVSAPPPPLEAGERASPASRGRWRTLAVLGLMLGGVAIAAWYWRDSLPSAAAPAVPAEGHAADAVAEPVTSPEVPEVRIDAPEPSTPASPVAEPVSDEEARPSAQEERARARRRDRRRERRFVTRPDF